MLLSVLLILCFNRLVSTLQHEKSFKFDLAATSVFDIGFYNKSLLITSAADIIQKDIETGQLQRRFIGHTGQINSFKVFNGSTMITSGWDDMVIVWDLVTGSILKRISLGASKTYPSSIQFVGDDLLVCGIDGKVRMVSMVAGRVVQTISNLLHVCSSVY
jgi:WD40 repeat protein